MLLRSCVSLALVLGALQGASGAESREGGTPGALPTWRIQARPYLSFEEVGCGVYHRLADRWDVGCRLSMDVSNDASDGAEGEPDSQDDPQATLRYEENDARSIDLDFDLRRWAMKGDRWGWYVGPCIGFGYTKSHGLFSNRVFGEDASTYFGNRRDAKDFHLSGSLVVGADVTLLREVSVTIGLRPLRYWYSWSEEERTVWNERTGADPRRETGEGKGETANLATDLTPEAFIVLRIW
jgi:hypothetical protein